MPRSINQNWEFELRHQTWANWSCQWVDTGDLSRHFKWFLWNCLRWHTYIKLRKACRLAGWRVYSELQDGAYFRKRVRNHGEKYQDDHDHTVCGLCYHVARAHWNIGSFPDNLIWEWSKWEGKLIRVQNRHAFPANRVQWRQCYMRCIENYWDSWAVKRR